MSKWICIKEVNTSNNKLKIIKEGQIVDIQHSGRNNLSGKESDSYSLIIYRNEGSKTKYAYYENNVLDNFISISDFREQQMKSILDE